MTTTDKPAAAPARSPYTHCIQCGKKLPQSNEQRTAKIATRSSDISNADPEVRFCTLRCAAGYGVDTARAWERRGISLKHPAQREAEAAGSKNLPAALAHAAAATGPTAEDPQP